MWCEDQETVFYINELLDKAGSKVKLATFDLDYTIIKTKSGKKFPVDSNDWEFLNNVITKITTYKEKGYLIALFTNQSKLKDPANVVGFKEKIENIVEALGGNIQVYISKTSGYYRKPQTGMWDKMLSINNIDKISSKSFYCGDAAGRVKDWKKNVKKDFACTDRMFANNVGVKFKTPEYVFEAEPETDKWEYKSITLDNYLTTDDDISRYESLSNEEQEIVLMCGYPGVGKSTFCKKYFSQYEVINQDLLKTKNKCLKKAEEYIKMGNKVLIDNTNTTEETRKNYIDIAKKYKIPVKVVWIKIPFDVAQHLNNYRTQVSKGSIKMIPQIAYNTIRKNFIEPNLAENIDEIIEIDRIIDSEFYANKELHYQYI
tara:strand:- start:1326 stop:2444 length:1119 start_codon:yes stop_codon:yes gene_type:complete